MSSFAASPILSLLHDMSSLPDHGGRSLCKKHPMDDGLTGTASATLKALIQNSCIV